MVMPLLKPVLIIVSVSTKREAKRIAGILLVNRLIACANIQKCVSIFHWKKGTAKAKEHILTMKSVARHFKKIEAVILRESTYDCPVIEMIEVHAMNSGARTWLQESTVK